jgi:hypothetical protein
LVLVKILETEMSSSVTLAPHPDFRTPRADIWRIT